MARNSLEGSNFARDVLLKGFESLDGSLPISARIVYLCNETSTGSNNGSNDYRPKMQNMGPEVGNFCDSSQRRLGLVLGFTGPKM